MAVRGILKGLTGGSASVAEVEADPGQAAVVAPGDAARRLQILDDFEQAGIGWIWATDAQGRLIYLSANASEKLGKPASELLAQPLDVRGGPADRQQDRSDVWHLRSAW